MTDVLIDIWGRVDHADSKVELVDWNVDRLTGEVVFANLLDAHQKMVETREAAEKQRAENKHLKGYMYTEGRADGAFEALRQMALVILNDHPAAEKWIAAFLEAGE